MQSHDHCLNSTRILPEEKNQSLALRPRDTEVLLGLSVVNHCLFLVSQFYANVASVVIVLLYFIYRI